MESLFDGLFGRLFRSGVKPLQIGRRLLQVVDAERAVDGQGRRVVPDTYLVQLSPEDRREFEDLEMSLLQELTIAVREYIVQEGYHVNGKARVSLRTNSELRRGRFEVVARHAGTDTGDLASGPSTPPLRLTDTPGVTPSAATASVVPGTSGPDEDRPIVVLILPTGQHVELHEGHYVVGRQLQCDIVLNDSNISRRHAEFHCTDGEVVVRDLGSTNGTKVNGVVVHGDQVLRTGDVIGLGGTELRVEAP